MRAKESNIVQDNPVSQMLTRLINECSKSQHQIAAEAGLSQTNIITMLKQGRTKLPLDRVVSLAEALDVSPQELMLAALKVREGSHWKEIARVIYEAVNEGLLDSIN